MENRIPIGIKIAIGSAIFLVIAVIAFIVFAPYAFIDSYEVGYKYNKLDGKITIEPRTGYVHRTPIFESIHVIDLRPRQVCINVGGGSQAGSNTSTSGYDTGVNSRVLNCKLVQFNPSPEGIALFLSWHGRQDYEGDILNDLLKIYAYDPSQRSYPFLTVLKELKNDNPAPVASPPVATPTAPVVR